MSQFEYCGSNVAKLHFHQYCDLCVVPVLYSLVSITPGCRFTFYEHLHEFVELVQQVRIQLLD